MSGHQLLKVNEGGKYALLESDDQATFPVV
jgi:hypothetical protein